MLGPGREGMAQHLLLGGASGGTGGVRQMQSQTERPKGNVDCGSLHALSHVIGARCREAHVVSKGGKAAYTAVLPIKTRCWELVHHASRGWMGQKQVQVQVQVGWHLLNMAGRALESLSLTHERSVRLVVALHPDASSV